MQTRIRRTGFALLLCALGGGLLAQVEDDPTGELDVEQFRLLRDQIESETGRPDEFKNALLELYGSAIGALEGAEADASRAAEYRRARGLVAHRIESLREELDRPVPEPRLELGDEPTAEQAEAALARERSRLAANRKALRDVERLTEERTAERNEIARRLGENDQQIEALSDALRAVMESELNSELKEATRYSLGARRQSGIGRVDRLRAELDLLDARGPLIPLQVDQAQRRLEQSEALVAVLEGKVGTLRRKEGLATRMRLREQCRAAAEQFPALASTAAETGELADLLWGPDGIRARAERNRRELRSTRNHAVELDRITQLMRRKFEAFGYRGSIGRWWPDVPDSFPEVGAIATAIKKLEVEIPAIQHRLIQFEQASAHARDYGRTVLEGLAGEGEEIAGTDEAIVRDLLDTRRDLLNDLIQEYGRYSTQLIERETVMKNFHAEMDRVEGFLYERLLWARSVPRPVVPRPADIGSALGWLTSRDNVSSLLQTAAAGIREHRFRSLLTAALFVALIAGRGRLRRRMILLAQRVSTPETDSFRWTVEAMVHTLLLAAPVPLVLYALGRLLTQPDTSVYVHSAAGALPYVALAAALVMLPRQVLSPQGLGLAHFRWPGEVLGSLPLPLWVPALFLVLMQIAVHLAMAGIRLSSSAELQLYSNALGRTCFVVALLVLSLPLLKNFRPRKGGATARPKGTSGRLYVYAYPVILLTMVLPAVLAAVGFYITGLLLAYQMLRSLWLLIVLLTLGGLLYRWRDRRRIAAARESESVTEPQVQKVLRFAGALIVIIGFSIIWSDAVPMLQILKRVQVWPQVTLAAAADAGAALSNPPSESADASPSDESGSQKSSPTALVGIPAAAPATAPVGSRGLTLWELVRAILAVLVTWVLVKNAPGLLDLVLLRRTHLDSGARIAMSTLLRYAILIVGVSAAFNILGLSWSKIQWLAAALTFGLGFGLQEIVANFVSGLILLVERPVRVGDAVTIGTLQGRVTRIQIRATTVTLWDRSEMIVPNREFITKSLVNWTLSDSERRIDVPLRVAYGADLEKVKKTLEEIAREHPSVLEDPDPVALLLVFGDDAIQFELRFFVDFGRGLKTKDEIQMTIDREFRAHDIEFAIPKLHLELPEGYSGPTKTA